MRGTYAATYDVKTGGTIILAFYNGLDRKNKKNMLLMPPLNMRETGWEVRDVALHKCIKDGDPN